MVDNTVRAAQAAVVESLRRQFSSSGQVPDAGLPVPVLRSWARCQRLGLDMGERVRPPSTTRGAFSHAAAGLMVSCPMPMLWCSR